MEKLIEATALAFGVSKEDLLSPARTDKLVRARFAAMLVLRRRGYSLPRIALVLGMKNHTAVIYGAGQALWHEDRDPDYRNAVEFIEKHSRMEHEALILLNGSGLGMKGRPKWEPENPVEVIKLYESGKSVLELSAICECAPSTPRRWLKGNGVELRKYAPGRRSAPDERIPKIMEMRKAGMTLEEIGTEFGITRERVRQIVVKAGLQSEFAYRPPTRKELDVYDEYRNGASLNYVAGKLGVGPETARKRLIAANIPIRPSTRKVRINEERDRKAREVVERYKSGESTKDIARAMGFKNPQQIYHYLGLGGMRPNRAKAAK